MIDLEKESEMLLLSEDHIISGFDCGNADLNDFFNRDALQYKHIIKDFCLFNYPDFVRFLLVDAYNEPAVVKFYQKNDFALVFSTEEQEKETYRQMPSEPLHTRYMFYDMIQLRNKLM